MSRYVHHDPVLSSILESYNKKEDEELIANDPNGPHSSTSESDADPIDIVDGTVSKEQKSEKAKGSSMKSKLQWSKIKRIIENTKDDATANTSMTDQERAFLKLRNRYLKESSSISSDEESGDEAQNAKPTFTKVVDDAMARARLRQDLAIRLSKLTAKEAQFLKDLVKDENVTKQQLEHANYVLNTDPLYRLPGETSSNIGSSGSTSVEPIEVPQNTKLKDFIQGHRVQIDGRDIEILLNWDEYGSELSKSEANLRMSSLNLGIGMNSDDGEKIPYFPSTFSYQTWAAIDKKEMKPIHGLPEEFNEASQVLSPPMMSSLRKALPFSVAEDYFWLKYAMNTHGASLQSLFHCIRQSPKTLLVIETVNGEIFGAYVSSPWRKFTSFYGSCEAFLWRMKKSRYTPTSSIEEQIELESDIDVYKWSQENRNIQMSDDSKLVIGGGFPDDENEDEHPNKWGLGIVLGKDLYEGTSSNCVTFQSPCLAQVSPKGEVFEVANMEVWAFTPCMSENDAEQLEMGRMFVLSHFDQL